MINELVKRLSEGKHEVAIGQRNESYEEIQKRIEDGFIHIKFINTKGGTELGINVDLDNTQISESDFLNKSGLIHIEGTTNLNYNMVKCIADIDIATRKGNGYLQIIETIK